jgi:hypothetical protein
MLFFHPNAQNQHTFQNLQLDFYRKSHPRLYTKHTSLIGPTFTLPKEINQGSGGSKTSQHKKKKKKKKQMVRQEGPKNSKQ